MSNATAMSQTLCDKCGVDRVAVERIHKSFERERQAHSDARKENIEAMRQLTASKARVTALEAATKELFAAHQGETVLQLLDTIQAQRSMTPTGRAAAITLAMRVKRAYLKLK
jgi:hypothetical protein